MSISASIPVTLVDQANAYLDEAGFGPSNFSVPMKASGESATHAGLHCWDFPPLKEALEAMVASGNFPGLTLGSGFQEHAKTQALAWESPENWMANPVMKGATRTYGGKTWESLLDYNVWTPPVGWREVVSSGWPEWIQPTGAHDAYKVGDKVTFQGKRYTSLINGNVWSPTAYPQGWKLEA